MKNEVMARQVRQSLNATLSGLSTTPWQRDRFYLNATGGYKVKKRIPLGLILVIALLLTCATALAAALLGPREVVEQMAVPMAQSSKQENYTHEELEQLITTLNENGITLDEGSRIMQAFRAGHGYWEQDTIREICFAAFGRDERAWSIDQQHWYAEMMVEIGAWGRNIYLLPEGEDMTVPQARARAAEALRQAYGVELPAESNDQWQIWESYILGWTPDANASREDRARWGFTYINRRTGNDDYSVSFDVRGGQIDLWRAQYLERIDTRSIDAVLDDLERREGVLTQWRVETWAEFGGLIQNLPASTRSAWLYQHAGYRLPPEGALSPEQALAAARREMGFADFGGWIEENAICCTDGDRPIYKVAQRVFYDAADVERRAVYDVFWVLELDCATGEVLQKRQYSYLPEGDVYDPDRDIMMSYVPFSLLERAPQYENRQSALSLEQSALFRYEQEPGAIEKYGEVMYFWPQEVLDEVYGGVYAHPTQAEYDRAMEIATSALYEKYGADALTRLGDWQVGLLHRRIDDTRENNRVQLDWDFMFTTDPDYLSDGYRVQIIQMVYADGHEEIVELTVEHANMGNG